MTEAEWQAITDPMSMLEFLEGKASERKLRLFAVYCVRSIFHLLRCQNCRIAVEVAEQFADSQATLETLKKNHVAFETELDIAWRDGPRKEQDGMDYSEKQDTLACDALGVAVAITEEFAEVCARDTIDATVGYLAHLAIPLNQWGTAAGDEAAMVAVKSERPKQIRLFLDIFGTPFRSTAIDSAWLAWNGGAVLKLAQAIYSDRTFDNLPVLAEALEDVGCDNEDILSHCRGPGPHVRGCWVLDLLLGKS